MSSFERLPQEIRNLIYEHCLLHDGEINPHPIYFERTELESKGCVPAKRMNFGDISMFRITNVRYSKQLPSVALLGVNHAIQHEAATILYGKNVWRISDTQLFAGFRMFDMFDMFDSYSSYFRHIVTSFDMRDVHPQHLMGITNHVMNTSGDYDKEHYGMGRRIHDMRIDSLCATWAFKQSSLEQMRLKSLVFDFRNLFCPNGCCRLSVIKLLCEQLGQDGPWYRLEPAFTFESQATNSTTNEAKRSTDVKVVGLRNPQEKRLIQNMWGLDNIDMEAVPEGPGPKWL